MKFAQPINLSTLLKIINCDSKIIGNKDILIYGINEIHSVESGDICFVDHPKYYKKTIQSPATLILINCEIEDIPEGKTLVIVQDPLTAYLNIVKYYRIFEYQEDMIADDLIIGEGSLIEKGAFIGKHVKIGKHCLIHANVTVYDYTTIGDNCIIHSGSVIGADAFYFQKRSNGWMKMLSCGSVIIENDVEIGAMTTIDKGVSGDTIIGEGCKFDNHVQVGHDTHIGKRCLIGSHAAIAGCTQIEEDCLIWAKAMINKDLIIKKGSTILAASGIDKSTTENAVLFGIPAIDARKKWKELAALRMLPEFMQEMEELKKKLNL